MRTAGREAAGNGQLAGKGRPRLLEAASRQRERGAKSVCVLGSSTEQNGSKGGKEAASLDRHRTQARGRGTARRVGWPKARTARRYRRRMGSAEGKRVGVHMCVKGCVKGGQYNIHLGRSDSDKERQGAPGYGGASNETGVHAPRRGGGGKGPYRVATLRTLP